MVGTIQMAMGLLRLGFLVNFLSHAVVSTDLRRGYPYRPEPTETFAGNSACVATIRRESAGQKPDGGSARPIPRRALGSARIFSYSFQEAMVRFRGHLRGDRRHVIVRVLRLDEAGVSIVGSVPAGLPRPSLPVFDAGTVRALIPAALTIVLVGFVESISIAQVIAVKERYRVEPNRELCALAWQALPPRCRAAFRSPADSPARPSTTAGSQNGHGLDSDGDLSPPHPALSHPPPLPSERGAGRNHRRRGRRTRRSENGQEIAHG